LVIIYFIIYRDIHVSMDTLPAELLHEIASYGEASYVAADGFNSVFEFILLDRRRVL
jgi:hypothetical protein